MAAIDPRDSTPGRIAEALGLSMCRSVVLRMGLSEPVTVTAEQFVEKRRLDGLLYEIESREYVLVPKEEYERMKK
jgi:hypothetical protein